MKDLSSLLKKLDYQHDQIRQCRKMGDQAERSRDARFEIVAENAIWKAIEELKRGLQTLALMGIRA